MSEADSGDKPHEPTRKKLEDARKKGEIPRSADLTTAAAYAGFLLFSLSLGSHALIRLGAELQGLIDRAPQRAQDMFGGGLQAGTGGVILSVLLSVMPWFLAPALMAALATAAQRSFLFTGSRLKPKLSRISIIANARNRFGRRGLFEFFKSFAKLLLFSAILGIFLLGRTDEILGAVALEPGQASGRMVALVADFLKIVTVIALAIGGIDLLWQRAEHLRRNRMSHKELMDEHKQLEGDPHVKQQRRQRGQEIALNKMLADVPGADVVIVNPSHYAVALKWSRKPGSAPVCVAKGVDEIAARIREIASQSGVPIHRDPPTARALHAAVPIGEEIRPEHFAAVAVAIRFADEMSRKRRSWGRMT